MRIITTVPEETKGKDLRRQDKEIVTLLATLLAKAKAQVIGMSMDSVTISRSDRLGINHEISGSRDELRPVRRAVCWLAQYSPTCVAESVSRSRAFGETRQNLPNSGRLPKKVTQMMRQCAKTGQRLSMVSMCFAHAYGLGEEETKKAATVEDSHALVTLIAGQNKGYLPTVPSAVTH